MFIDHSEVSSMLDDLYVNEHDKELIVNGELIMKGRRIRYLKSKGLIQVGDDNFDRWANSIELTFDVIKPSGRRQFERWAKKRLM